MTTQCRQCGSQLGGGAVLCAHCGRAADQSDPAAPPTLASELPPHSTESQPDSAAPLFSAVVSSADRGLTGIGGWLIPHVIGLAVAPFVSVFGIVADCTLLFGERGRAVLANNPGLGVVVLFEAITNLAFLIGLIVLNVLFYSKKKAFPSYIIIYMATQFVLLLADHLMAARFNPHAVPTAVFRSLLICVVWIPYFLRSRRVQLTFVN